MENISGTSGTVLDAESYGPEFDRLKIIILKTQLRLYELEASYCAPESAIAVGEVENISGTSGTVLDAESYGPEFDRQKILSLQTQIKLYELQRRFLSKYPDAVGKVADLVLETAVQSIKCEAMNGGDVSTREERIEKAADALKTIPQIVFTKPR